MRFPHLLTLDFFCLAVYFLFLLLLFFYCTIYTTNILQQLIMVIKFLCKICNKAVANNDHAVHCDKCHIWVHIKCNKIDLQTYKFLQKSLLVWYCIKYLKILFLLELSPMRNSLKQTNDPLLSLQKTTLHQARILSINSIRLWMTLHLQQFPASTMNPVSFHL